MRKKHPNGPTALMYVGARPEAIASAREAILAILNTEKCGDLPKKAAVEALSSLCRVDNVSIQNCTFGTGDKP